MADQEPNPSTPPEGGPISQAAAPPPVPAAGDPQPADEPLGEGGKRALEAERKRANEYAEQLKQLAPLAKLVDAIRSGQHVPEDEKTEVERLSEQLQQMQADNEKERLGRLRLEVATEKGLTAQQAARLQGTSREELASDAEALKALFPATEPQGARRPAPDPTQGGRGAPADLQTQIAAAEAKGDWNAAMQLKSQMLINQ